MLSKWLSQSERTESAYSNFGVIDSEETSTLSSEIKSHLVDLLHFALFDPDELNAFAEHLGWGIRESTGYRVPTADKVKRGDFGEIFVSAMLEQFHGYEIPVQKLRSKLTGNQTLTGTDIVALRVSDSDSIEEVCFVESKLRTSRDNDIAVEACEQLQKDYALETPAILPFIFIQLRRRGDGDRLFRAFRDYLADRSDNRYLDTFRLGLCFEHNEWREKVLENLDDDPVALNKLCVHVVRITDLRSLTDELFDIVGVSEVSEDD